MMGSMCDCKYNYACVPRALFRLSTEMNKCGREGKQYQPWNRESCDSHSTLVTGCYKGCQAEQRAGGKLYRVLPIES